MDSKMFPGNGGIVVPAIAAGVDVSIDIAFE
jgi:hypothetical protein